MLRYCKICGKKTINSRYPLCLSCWHKKKNQNVGTVYYCQAPNCSKKATKDLKGELYCDAHYDIEQSKRKTLKAIELVGRGLKWLFEKEYVPFSHRGVSGIARHTRIGLILLSIAFILMFIIVPLFLLLSGMFGW